MPWKEWSMMSQRVEFVTLASTEGAQMSELCRRFGISRQTGYKWLQRFACDGERGLDDRSRRPLSSSRQSSPEIEALIVACRGEHPRWGGRKLRKLLRDEGHSGLPAASTITQILRRHGLLNECDGAGQARAFQRFERETPNDLWQMDFKGHFALGNGERCHPLTVLDDHSRFSLCLQACADERLETVQTTLIQVFRRYGLPNGMLMDNGAPWGDAEGQPWTRLTAWLVRLGIRVSHGRARHPQTQGKLERWHRTLKAEVLNERFGDQVSAQAGFDPWREMYNTKRPHEALNMGVPADRYQMSQRSFPETLKAIEYAPDVSIRKVQSKGVVDFRGYRLRIGNAFVGDPVGLRATRTEGVYEVRYCAHQIGLVDLRTSHKGGPVVVLSRRTESDT